MAPIVACPMAGMQRKPLPATAAGITCATPTYLGSFAPEAFLRPRTLGSKKLPIAIADDFGDRVGSRRGLPRSLQGVVAAETHQFGNTQRNFAHVFFHLRHGRALGAVQAFDVRYRQGRDRMLGDSKNRP